MSRPFLMVAPNGARRSKADHASLPLTLAETLATARACHAAGADALHLHVRDETGAHSLDAGRYREALDELARTLPKMRLQITTEAAGVFEVNEQLAYLKARRPPWASVSVREIARAPELAAHLYATCEDNKTEVQHILYDATDVALLQDWQARGIIRPKQTSVIYVLGRYTSGQASKSDDLLPFLAAHKERQDWMVCAFGPEEHICLLAAAKQGGSLRVGFENSLVSDTGTPHKDNAASVSALIAQLERIPA